MKKYVFVLMISFLSLFFITFCSDQNKSIKEWLSSIIMKKSEKKLTTSLCTLSEKGLDKKLGTVTVLENDHGISIYIDANGITPGEHGIHIHEKNVMLPSKDKDGNDIIGGMAGGHWDPHHTNKHLGPQGKGHKGDLPKIIVPKSGVLQTVIQVPDVYIKDIKGRSIIIHADGDNYSDDPMPLGGGGARMYGIKFNK